MAIQCGWAAVDLRSEQNTKEKGLNPLSLTLYLGPLDTGVPGPLSSILPTPILRPLGHRPGHWLHWTWNYTTGLREYPACRLHVIGLLSFHDHMSSFP
jgi:hypothetical protein